MAAAAVAERPPLGFASLRARFAQVSAAAAVAERPPLGFASLRARFAQVSAAAAVAERPPLGFASLRARFARLQRTARDTAASRRPAREPAQATDRALPKPENVNPRARAGTPA